MDQVVPSRPQQSGMSFTIPGWWQRLLPRRTPLAQPLSGLSVPPAPLRAGFPAILGTEHRPVAPRYNVGFEPFRAFRTLAPLVSGNCEPRELKGKLVIEAKASKMQPRSRRLCLDENVEPAKEYPSVDGNPHNVPGR